jgi:hypothetical protein
MGEPTRECLMKFNLLLSRWDQLLDWWEFIAARFITRHRRAFRVAAVVLIVVAVFMLAGCLSIPADPSKMSAEQLREWVKDKNANVSCGKLNTPYGPTVLTYVVLDKAVVFNGSVSVDADCKVVIQNDSRVVKP